MSAEQERLFLGMERESERDGPERPATKSGMDEPRMGVVRGAVAVGRGGTASGNEGFSSWSVRAGYQP